MKGMRGKKRQEVSVAAEVSSNVCPSTGGDRKEGGRAKGQGGCPAGGPETATAE